MRLIIIFIIIIFGLIIFGCSENNEDSSVEEFTEDAVGDNFSVQEVQENVCGNGICEKGEGCNKLTQETACKEDCSVCEASIFLLSKRCDGGCNKGLNSFEFVDSGKIKFTLKNLGEKNLDSLEADLDCKFDSGNVEYETYFENGEKSVKLSARETTYYYIDIKGSSSFELNCDIVFRGGYSVIFDKVRLKRW